MFVSSLRDNQPVSFNNDQSTPVQNKHVFFGSNEPEQPKTPTIEELSQTVETLKRQVGLNTALRNCFLAGVFVVMGMGTIALFIASAMRDHLQQMNPQQGISSIQGVEPGTKLDDTKIHRTLEKMNLVHGAKLLQFPQDHMKRLAEYGKEATVLIKDVSRRGPDIGQGSGFIYRDDGIIVTNEHVVNMGEIYVYLLNGERYKAQILDADREKDLAVLKIDVDYPLPFLELSKTMEHPQGQELLAIGNPAGLGWSAIPVTISGPRRVTNKSPKSGVVQLNRELVRGNSGGPLLNLSGEVEGIAEAAMHEISFMIPSSTVRETVDDILADHPVVK